MEAPPAAVPAPPPPPAPESAPDYKKINTGFGLRVGGAIQGAPDRSKLNDFGLDEMYVEARFSGQLTPMFAWQANFNGGVPTGGMAGGTSGAAIMDLITSSSRTRLLSFGRGACWSPPTVPTSAVLGS